MPIMYHIASSSFCESCRVHFASSNSLRIHNRRVHQPRRIASNIYSSYCSYSNYSAIEEDTDETETNTPPPWPPSTEITATSDPDSDSDSSGNDTESSVETEIIDPIELLSQEECEFCHLVCNSVKQLMEHQRSLHDCFQCFQCTKMLPREEYYSHLEEHTKQMCWTIDSNTGLPGRRHLYSTSDPSHENADAILRCPNCPNQLFTLDEEYFRHKELCQTSET